MSDFTIDDAGTILFGGDTITGQTPSATSSNTPDPVNSILEALANDVNSIADSATGVGTSNSPSVASTLGTSVSNAIGQSSPMAPSRPSSNTSAASMLGLSNSTWMYGGLAVLALLGVSALTAKKGKK